MTVSEVMACLACLLPGCATLDADMIRALADDSASFCARSKVSGGAGGGGLMAGAVTGGWGSADFAFCRSNQKGAKVSILADGTIVIEQ